MLKIDADSHLAEPGDLWDRYLEPKIRDEHPLRIVLTDEGWETLLIDGKISGNVRNYSLSSINGMGKTYEEVLASTYDLDVERGTRDPKERLAVLDEAGLDATVLYPSLGLVWNAEVLDGEVAIAYCRAYNRWLEEFCADSGGRLVPTAMIIPEDPSAAVAEIERIAALGWTGFWMPQSNVCFKSHAHPDFDPVWAAAQDHDLTVSFHPCVEPPQMRVHQRFHDMQRWAKWHFTVCGHQMMQQALSALFQYGLWDRFPKVRFALMESAAGWVPHLVHRMDAVVDTSAGDSLPLKNGKPSDYFKQYVWVAADPDEPYFDALVAAVGSDRLVWGSDYPHHDHSPDYMSELTSNLAGLDEVDQRNIWGNNARKLWRIDVSDRAPV